MTSFLRLSRGKSSQSVGQEIIWDKTKTIVDFL